MKIQKNIALEFNEFSKNYTKDMIGCVPHYLKLLSSFVDFLPENFQPSSILDLGCGNGNVTVRLLPCFPKATFTLVDASSEMIDFCKSQFENYQMKYAQTYFKDFAFESEKYDLIVAGFSLHHCKTKEKQSIFKKIFQALKKGGIFSCSDLMINKLNPDHPKLLEEWEAFFNNTFPDGEKWKWLMEHYAAFDNPDNYFDQIKWLEDARFNNIVLPFREGFWTHLQTVKE